VIHHPLVLIFDLVSLFALCCVIIAGIRRVFFPPYPEAITADAFVILSMVGLLMIAYFNLHGVEIALGNDPSAAFMPISSLTGSMFYTGISASAASPLISFWWWAHALILLAFLNYLPYSKHMHILSSIPSCYFRRFDKPNTQPTETFVKGRSFGVENVAQYTWKDLFDSYSCTECGRCQMVCPASNTNKPLNPRKIVHDIKINLIENGPDMMKGQPPGSPSSAVAARGASARTRSGHAPPAGLAWRYARSSSSRCPRS
jgi:ferredoxin